MHIIHVTPENVAEHGLFCIKNQKTEGFLGKRAWFEQQYQDGLRFSVIKTENGATAGFIETVPAEAAWRPIDADGFDFIHCLYVASKDNRNSGAAAALLESAMDHSRRRKRKGLVVMTSEGPWLADCRVFEKNGFVQVDRKGRFELFCKGSVDPVSPPQLIDWTLELPKYVGWQLLYADQCPWHQKAVKALQEVAFAQGIELHVRKIISSEEARRAPSGFGVFALVRDGRLLADHYISATRFKNILRSELSQ